MTAATDAARLPMDIAFSAKITAAMTASPAARLNEAGHRAKAYSSRRQVVHAGREFQLTTVQHMLKNVSYIVKKSVVIDG